MQPVPTALLQRWYSLVREKRASRQDFLKALVKVFDVNNALKSSQVGKASLVSNFHYGLDIFFIRMTSILQDIWPRTFQHLTIKHKKKCSQ